MIIDRCIVIISDFDSYLRSAALSKELNDSCCQSYHQQELLWSVEFQLIKMSVYIGCSFVISKKLYPSIFHLILVWP